MSFESEDEPDRDENDPTPLSTAEYRKVLRSFLGRCAFAVLCAIALSFPAASGRLPLGIVPAALLGLGFGFGTGAKLFPESGFVLRRRFRNYRRAKKGLELLAEDDVPEVSYHSDFRRG